MEPLPLYGMLPEMGFRWRTQIPPSIGSIEIWIWRDQEEITSGQAA